MSSYGLAGTVIDGAFKIADRAWGEFKDFRNWNSQKEQQQYDREMQQLIMSREDNAIQRRVADLKAAGINPVLAAGQGAGSGIAYHSHAPQMNKTEQAIQFAGYMAELNKIKAETRRTNAEARRLEDSHDRDMTAKDYANLEAKFNVDNQTIRLEMLKLERDSRLQHLDKGEREKLAATLKIAEQQFNLNENLRDAIIRRLTFQREGSHGIVDSVLDGIINGSVQSLSALLGMFGIELDYNVTESGRMPSINIPKFNDRYGGN